MFNQSTMLAAGDTGDFITPLPPTAEAGGPYVTTNYNGIQLNGTVVANAGEDLVIKWTADGPGTFDDDSIEDPVFTPTSYGTYELTLTVTTSNTNAVIDTASYELTPPTADAGGPYNVDWNQPQQLNGTVVTNGAENLTIQWSASVDGEFDDDSIEDPVFTPAHDGTYTVTITLISDNGYDVIDHAALVVNVVAPIVELNASYELEAGYSQNLSPTNIVLGSDQNATTQWSIDGSGFFMNYLGVLYPYVPGSSATITYSINPDDGPTVQDSATITSIRPASDLPYFTSNTSPVTVSISSGDASPDAWKAVDNDWSGTSFNMGVGYNYLQLTFNTAVTPSSFFIYFTYGGLGATGVYGSNNDVDYDFLGQLWFNPAFYSSPYYDRILVSPGQSYKYYRLLSGGNNQTVYDFGMEYT